MIVYRKELGEAQRKWVLRLELIRQKRVVLAQGQGESIT